ncbi:MAG: molybdate ABC transporter substrate-binding protein, partial [Pseudomonadota bacterium]
MSPTALLLAMCLALSAAVARAEPVVVFAAASLKTALDQVVEELPEDLGPVTVAYSGSAVAARQVDRGAPADIVFLAHPVWMDWLAERGRIVAESRTDLLGNRLVLVAGPGAAKMPDISRLPERLGDDVLAMAFVEAVPAGIYGKAALTHAGLWHDLAAQVAQSDNVRAALALVARGEAPFGIVYATDVAIAPELTVAWTFAPESHPPIRYPVALTAEARPRAHAV